MEEWTSFPIIESTTNLSLLVNSTSTGLWRTISDGRRRSCSRGCYSLLQKSKSVLEVTSLTPTSFLATPIGIESFLVLLDWIPECFENCWRESKWNRFAWLDSGELSDLTKGNSHVITFEADWRKTWQRRLIDPFIVVPTSGDIPSSVKTVTRESAVAQRVSFRRLRESRFIKVTDATSFPRAYSAQGRSLEGRRRDISRGERRARRVWIAFLREMLALLLTILFNLAFQKHICTLIIRKT